MGTGCAKHDFSSRPQVIESTGGTVQEAGWSGKQNGELLSLAEICIASRI
jgi:hypothetical protein